MPSEKQFTLNSDEIDDWTFKDEKPTLHIHGLHSYPARMHPPVARKAIQLFASKGDLILDPFCGSGGVLAEAKIQGYRSIGIDINPLACLLSRVKTNPINPDVIYTKWVSLLSEIKDTRKKFPVQEILPRVKNANKIKNKDEKKIRLEEIIKEFWKTGIKVPDFSQINILYWFKPKSIIELAIIKKCINNILNEKIKEFFHVCFSKTVRQVCGTRNGEFKLYRIPPDKWKNFNPNALDVFSKIVRKNIVNMSEYYNFFYVKNQSVLSTIIQSDTRKIFSDEFPEEGKKLLFEMDGNSIKGKVNLIVTSPPYGDSGTTVAYGQFSRYLSFWLGYEKEEYYHVDKESLGGRSKHGKLNSISLEETLEVIKSKDQKRATQVNSFFVDLNTCLDNLFKVLTPNGKACFIVGNRTVKEVKIPTDKIIVELGEEIGFRHIDTFSRKIPTKRIPWKSSPTNIPGKKVNTMAEEKIVAMGKG
ncbi:MAG: DNA adenine methylase [Candidatus Bathyarchaeota archaeon]